MTTRTPDQIKADQEFLAKARRLSPKFPPINDAIERRHRAREAFAARALLALFIGGLIYGMFFDSFGFIMALFSFVGFTATCIYAGNRQYVRAGGGLEID